MHIHHLTLKQLAVWLNQRMAGFDLLECFSQTRDELVLGFAGHQDQLFLRVGCGMPLPYIWPMDDFKRARKNVVELFDAVVGREFEKAEVVPWERILILYFDGGHELILKMHGSQSNVLLRRAGQVEELFRQQKEEDLAFAPEGGTLNWEQADVRVADEFDEVKRQLKTVSPALGPEFARWVFERKEAVPSLREALQPLLSQAGDEIFFVERQSKRIKFHLFDPGKPAEQKAGLHEALNFFFRNYFLYRHYQQKFQETQKLLGKPLKKLKGQEGSYYRNLDKLENKRSDEEIGHILMANLHNLKTGMEHAELQDFYHEKTIKIKLDPRKNPQQNAEQYYQKHKKRKVKRVHLEELIEGLAPKIEALETIKQEFDAFPEPEKLNFGPEGFDYAPVRALAKFRKKNAESLQSGQEKQQAQQQRFMEFEKGGFKIYVGRNAKNNDELTLHHARKDDVWLHAKDVAGSHVIIRRQGNKEVPKNILEFAAGLAAWFSKRRNEALVPVAWTAKKYVRKTRHLAPGEVIVEREDVVLVEPHRFES